MGEKIYGKRKNKKIRNIFLISFILLTMLGYFVYSSFSKEESYREMFDSKVSKSQLETFEKELDIHEVDYKWGDGLKEGNHPKKLVIHHSATNRPESPEEIHKMHLNRGWSGIGYHFYIRKDGTIYRGRPENVIGSHAKGGNYNTLGICVEGNFEKNGLNEAQKISLINLSTYLSLKYPIKNIIPHRDVTDTLCPGSFFPLESVKNSIIEKIKSY